MPLDPRLAALFDELEQQAAGLELAERDRELAEQRRAEYATVDLVSRLHASVGSRVQLAAPVVGVLEGVLSRVGVGWLLLQTGSPGPGTEWLVRTAAIASMRGLSDRAVPAEVRSVTARLGLGSALRQVVASGRGAVLHLGDGRVVHGVPVRVGADFAEVRVVDGPAYTEVVPFSALVALQVAP
jgi:hypothetical protein